MILVPLAPLAQPVGQIQDHVFLILELRERYERRANRDFNSSVDDDRGDLNSRWRVGVETKPKSGPKLTLVYQYAHDLVATPTKNFSVENSDMKIAQLAGVIGHGWNYTAGRQKISIGQDRLIAGPEWGNVTRAYDGLRVSNASWDFFGVSVGVNSPRLHDARVAAATYKKGSSINSFFYKHDLVGADTVDIYTLSRFEIGRYHGFDWQYEVAGQFGRNQGLDHRAWAAHGYLGRKVAKQTSVFGVVDYASGSGSVSKSETFDSLYGAHHGRFGNADLAGWRNIVLASLGAEHVFSKDSRLKVQYYRFWLANSKDGWYNSSCAQSKVGATTLKDPTGNAGRNLGSEVDIEYCSKTGQIAWGIGVSAFMPGSFVSNLLGTKDNQSWGYVQASYKF